MAEKILIVDDDLETLRLVGLMLQRQGYQVVAASNGALALQMVQSEKPDLILLDLMMPDIDGYEVTRQVRADPVLGHTPILMFTARSMMDDKVAGYEAGANDYLTKPTHPVELTAKIKSLLARTVKIQPPISSNQKGHVVALMAARGGVGTSTLALNLGVSIHQKTKSDVIIAEMRPGNGTIGLELGYTEPTGLSRLLQLRPIEVTRESVEKELVSNASGVRLLLASYNPLEVECTGSTAQVTAVLNHLSSLAQVVIVDLGTNLFPGLDQIVNSIDEIILVVEPTPNTVTRTKTLMENLADKGFGKSKLLTAALVNRSRSDVMLSWSNVQDTLAIPVTVVVTPAPELAYQAALRFTPMILLQPDGLYAQQVNKFADQVIQHIPRG
jgi:pilus assembly protein CpaE